MKYLICGIFMATFAQFGHAVEPSPYVGQEKRSIKSLSQKEIDAYLTGKGMGFASAFNSKRNTNSRAGRVI
jgi:hypothetical protein